MNEVKEKIAKATAEINQNPSADAYKQRGDLYTGEGDHASAYSDYDQAAALNPENVRLQKKRIDALRNSLRDAEEMA